MMTFNKMEQLLYFSICFLSNVLIIVNKCINCLSKYIKTRQNDGSTPVVVVLKSHCRHQLTLLGHTYVSYNVFCVT